MNFIWHNVYIIILGGLKATMIICMALTCKSLMISSDWKELVYDFDK